MSEVTQPQTQTLEQTLNKTDLGHLIYEHKKSFFAAILTVVVAVCAFYAWKEIQASRATKLSAEVFEFQNKVWTEAQSGKVAPTDLVANFDKLDAAVQTAPVMLPLVLDMGKFLYDKGLYAEAESVLRKVDGKVKNSMATFFVGLQLSVVLEKQNKLDEAISVLDKLASTKDGLMPAKVYLDLGRLYLLKGDKGNAQSKFEEVMNSYPNDDMAKIAKLYLSQISR